MVGAAVGMQAFPGSLLAGCAAGPGPLLFLFLSVMNLFFSRSFCLEFSFRVGVLGLRF